MAYYRAYLLDEDRCVIAVAKFHCADDQVAQERARESAKVNDIELWQLDRRIAVFEAFSKIPHQEERLSVFY